MTVLLVLGILVFLIVVHELGHFVAAKIFKVKVEEFGIGYPPRAFTFGLWGNTEYTINWLPFGGFVRLFGEHGNSPETHGAHHVHHKGSFASAPKYAQALILVAGVTMNAIAAWFLFATALHMGIPREVEEGKAITSEVRLYINRVIDDSPAAAAGLKSGDEIVKLEDAQTHEVTELKPSKVVSFIGARGGKPIDLTFKRSEEVRTVTVIPAHAVVEKSANRPAIGFGMALVTDASMPWFEALRSAFTSTYTGLTNTVLSLSKLITDAVAGEPNVKDIVGPVGLVDFVGNASRHGIGHVLALAGFISINLAVINLIPIPALDGGRLFLLGIETIIRRPPNKLAVQILNFFGVSLIVALMVTVTYHDVVRLLT